MLTHAHPPCAHRSPLTTCFIRSLTRRRFTFSLFHAPSRFIRVDLACEPSRRSVLSRRHLHPAYPSSGSLPLRRLLLPCSQYLQCGLRRPTLVDPQRVQLSPVLRSTSFAPCPVLLSPFPMDAVRGGHTDARDLLREEE